MQIGDKNMLIDSGISKCTDDHIAEIKKILKYDKIAENAPVPNEKKIHYIYITHYHWDHAGGLTAISNAIDMHGATIFLPENPPQEYYIVDDHLNNTYDVAKNCEMTVIIPGGTAGRYIKTTTNNVDSYTFEHLTDMSNKTSFSIGRNHELTLDFKNCSTHDYYFYKDESGNERFRTEIFTETIKASTNSFVPVKSLIKNGIKDTNGNYYDFKITIKGEAPYYASVTLDSNGNKKYPSITVPTNGSATIEYLGINADYNNTSLCCVMTYGKTRIGFFGDIGLEAQEHLANDEVIGHLDLMNVPHHGVDSGHYRPLYDSIAPKMCFTQDAKGFHYDSNDKADWHILSEHSKTHAYLQENGMPNYAVSTNGTITFNIYKSGISTTANAIHYPINVKGVTSYMGAINNNVPGTTTNINIVQLLKNMERGTILSTIIERTVAIKLWNNLLDGLVENNVSKAQLIVYKGASSKFNLDKANRAAFYAQENEPLLDTYNDPFESGYIIVIPHSSNRLCGPIVTHWESQNNYASIKLILKPLTDTEHFKFVKEATGDDVIDYTHNSSYLESDGFKIVPKAACTLNYTAFFQNTTASKMPISYSDGDSLKNIKLPANSFVTITNYAILSATESLVIPNNEGLYVKLCGYVTYSQARAQTRTIYDVESKLPEYNTFPKF